MTDLPANLPAVVADHKAELAQRAYQLEESIVGAIRNIRHQWVVLAEALYDFHAEQAWLSLGYPNLEQWLASPDIEIGRRMFFVLVETHRELVIQRGVPRDVLGSVDMSKVQDVLPSIRRGQVDARTAIADCEALSRTDLRDKYSGRSATQKHQINDEPVQPDSFHYERCPNCGGRMKVADA